MSNMLSKLMKTTELERMLTAFQIGVGLPIYLLDEAGAIIASKGQTPSYCHIFTRHLNIGNACIIEHLKAAKLAQNLGEPMIFSCHANLNHIIFSLVKKGQFIGFILVGPFLMNKPDISMVTDLVREYGLKTEIAVKLYEKTGSIKSIDPGTVEQISRLLYYLFHNFIADVKEELEINQSKLYQQAKIGESIQNYKLFNENKESIYPYNKEKDLISKVRVGNIEDARLILNELLGYVFFADGNNLEITKARATEFCSLISRAAIEGGAATDTVLAISNQFITSLSTIDNLETLCFRLQKTLDAFIDSMFDHLPDKNQALIKKAVAYIGKNYNKDLSLEEVANHVHLNPTYFSSIFKHLTDLSFTQYLNMVRIEESKILLSNTDYSIIDIALAVGFEDQSYFSKVFKKITGKTPKQSR